MGWFTRKPRWTCAICGFTGKMDYTYYRCGDNYLCSSCGQKAERGNCKATNYVFPVPLSKVEDAVDRYEAAQEKERQMHKTGMIAQADKIQGLPIDKDKAGEIRCEDDGFHIIIPGEVKAVLPFNRVLHCSVDTKIVPNGPNALDGDPALRALVGGALLGEVGAIAGAVSVKKQPTLTAIHTFEIVYKDKAGRTKKISAVRVYHTEFTQKDPYFRAQTAKGGNPFGSMWASFNMRFPNRVKKQQTITL